MIPSLPKEANSWKESTIIGTLGILKLVTYGGIITLTKCLALEWVQDNVKVNIIAP